MERGRPCYGYQYMKRETTPRTLTRTKQDEVQMRCEKLGP